jgi:uncharacterized protein YabE (DUF348 family)
VVLASTHTNVLKTSGVDGDKKITPKDEIRVAVEAKIKVNIRGKNRTIVRTKRNQAPMIEGQNKAGNATAKGNQAVTGKPADSKCPIHKPKKQQAQRNPLKS